MAVHLETLYLNTFKASQVFGAVSESAFNLDYVT